MIKLSAREYKALSKRSKKNKYNATRVRIDGFCFDSKAEASYYCLLKMLRSEGKIKFFIRQIPFTLTIKKKYYLDFMIFGLDGTVQFVDVKGYCTEAAKLKIKQVEHEYGINITLLKKEGNTFKQIFI